VLVIIFMVAAPFATVDVAVNLPASTAPQQPRPDKPVFVTLRADTLDASFDAGVPYDARLEQNMIAVTLGPRMQRALRRRFIDFVRVATRPL
jgi:biopolymer transport protein ExbD